MNNFEQSKDTSVSLPALASQVPSLNLRSAALLGLLGSMGCTQEGDTIINNYYTVPEAETTTEFVTPDQCGVIPTVEPAEFPATKFYGPESDGIKIAILVEKDQLDLANELVNSATDYPDGYVNYIPGEGNDVDMADEAKATLCITLPDDSATTCVEGTFKLVGGMTRTEWHGEGEGYGDEALWDPTIPSFNLDVNAVEDFKIEDEFTGRKIDNVRLNSGQTLGLASAAISYELAAEHGVVNRPTGYVKVISNVYGLDAENGGCIAVPQLNVMRDQDGNVCEFNEDGLPGDCSFGLEGYSLSDPTGFTCEWAKDDGTCDSALFNTFASTVNDSMWTPGFAEMVAPYMDQTVAINIIADEIVQHFWDGYRAGNNNVFSATTSTDASVKFNPEPYSRDYALLGSTDYWFDFTYADSFAGGYLWDPATCSLIVDRVREMNSTMEADCTRITADHFDRIRAIDAYRPQDDEIVANKELFCTTYPVALEAALVDFQAQCDALTVSADTGF